MKKIKKNIYYLGVNDSNRKLFDAIFPLPNGTSYNSYLIKGSKKTVLIDTVDNSKSEEFIKSLAKIKKLDYIVSNHAEQDHSGSIKKVLEKYPEARVMTTAYCKSMLIDLHHISEDKFVLVSENEEISLGDKTIKFIFTPWAHWPETFSTYLIEDKVLFSCDFFGAHVVNKNLFVENYEKYLEYAKLYFAEIMMPFREILKRNIEKVEELDLEIIAPSHGEIYQKPQEIIDAYKDWIYPEPKNKVLVPYVTMHGSTEILVRDLEQKLINENIEVTIINLEKKDIGEIAKHLVDSKFLILGAPTLLSEAHIAVTTVASITRLLKAKIKHVGIIGSYGWGGRTVESIENALNGMNVEYFNPVLIKGLPRDEDLEQITDLVNNIKKTNN